MTLDLVIHYGGTAFLAAFAFFSSSLGQARIGKAALKASDRQPGDDRAIKKIFFTGIALSETVALIALGAAIYLFYSPITSPVQIYVRIAVYAAIIVPCVLISYLGSASIAESLQSAARQPFLVQQILNFMLVTQSLMQTPVIFCAIFAFIITMQAKQITTLPAALQLSAAGIMLALCSIGPCIGLSYFIKHASKSLRINRASFGQLFSCTFISQAIIETPFLLGLATTIVLLQLEVTTISKGITLICAALALGGCTIPVSIASAYASAKILPGVAANPQHAPKLARFSIFCQAFIDTTAIYGLIIALLIISF